ncbi:MAG: glycosyltransferase family 4 protein [Candidatus Magasanikbacteria bacterium]
MHICFLYPGFPPETHAGGIGTYIFEITRLFSNTPIKISIISRSNNFFDEKVERLSLNTTLYRLGEEEKAKYNEIFLFNNYGFKNYYQRVLKKVKQINSEHSIDIIESCDWGAEGVLLLDDFYERLIVKCHTPSFISESYNPMNKPYLSDEIKIEEKKFIGNAKTVICPSNSLIQKISEFISINGNIMIESYPIKITEIVQKRDYAINKEIRLLTVGRIEQRKGHDIIIQAMNQLQDVLNITLDVFGADTPTKSGEYISSYFLKQLDKRLQSKVTFHNEIHRNELIKKYAEFDIFVAASRFDNFPFTVLEAMSAGLPVIGSNNSGIKEQIIDQNNGLLFDGTPSDLCKKINTLFQNKILREKIGRNGFKYMKNNFSLKSIKTSILSNYNSFLAQ